MSPFGSAIAVICNIAGFAAFVIGALLGGGSALGTTQNFSGATSAWILGALLVSVGVFAVCLIILASLGELGAYFARWQKLPSASVLVLGAWSVVLGVLLVTAIVSAWRLSARVDALQERISGIVGDVNDATQSDDVTSGLQQLQRRLHNIWQQQEQQEERTPPSPPPPVARSLSHKSLPLHIAEAY